MARIQALEVSPNPLPSPPPAYNPRVLNFIDDIAEVDVGFHEVTASDSSGSSSDEESASTTNSTGRQGNIYIDDTASECSE